ncbi:MAG: Fe-S protein assembly co-chaperone HscB [Gammaproteobacteria bacterium]|nr:Fe-S protein assembly co-chaperone HscB [Gammaproteobacteria bacterium]
MNYFELFDLPQQFPVDLAQLTARYHTLQKALHPDRFVNASNREQSEAVRYASLINDGYQTLKSPLQRAVYLLAQQQIVFDFEQQTVTDEAFLMQQISLRQQLDEKGQLEAVRQQVSSAIATIEVALQQQFANQAWQSAKAETLKLQFYYKLDQQVKDKIG